MFERPPDNLGELIAEYEANPANAEAIKRNAAKVREIIERMKDMKIRQAMKYAEEFGVEAALRKFL